MSNLTGVIPAIPTPLLPGEIVDARGLQNVIDYVIAQGASGIFALGSMGEGPALLDSQKREVVKIAIKHINGRVPLLVGISDVSTQRVLVQRESYQDLSVDYFVATAPFYYSFPHPDSIVQFVQSLSAALSKPLFFYNSPGMTGNPVRVDVLDRILNMDNVAGIKNSSSDFSIIAELLRRYPDKTTRPGSIFQGDEFTFDVAILMGADGIITGGGTVFLNILKQLFKAASDNDRTAAMKLQRKFRRSMDDLLGPDIAIDWMFKVKTKLKDLGICGNEVTSPFLTRI